ncbi:MAG: hypothetical protein GY799_26040, partial [Desulfobulbaceae bacterium]|nr:hypothetical protein [Desulfobulbaceae bacterium]
MGGAISQMVDGKERIVAYWSKTLKPTERNYSTVECENLAIVNIVENFRHLLMGRRFTVRTDQHSLKFLGNQSSLKKVSHRIERWRMRLQVFSFSIEYIQGSKNTLADMLSRLDDPDSDPNPTSLPDDDDSIIIASASCPGPTLQEIRSNSAQDSVLKTVSLHLKSGWPEKNSLPSALCRFFKERTRLSEKDGILFYDDRIIVPLESQNSVLSALHTGH